MVAVARRYVAPPWFDVRDYAATVVTVPAPTAAATLSLGGFGGSNFTDARQYDVAYSYLGWTGESALSPAASFTAANLQGMVAVLPKATKTSRAVGARVYIKDVTSGGIFRLAAGFNAQQNCFGFAGDTGFGVRGAGVGYTAVGAAHPGTANALESGGIPIAAPTLAPDIAPLGALPISTTYYAAYSYVGADGTETALSPTSASVTTSTVGGYYLDVRRTLFPPNGVVFVNIYMSTDGTTWRRQLTNQPLGHVVHTVHEFNVAGAAPSPSTPQSEISPFQLAYDAAMNAGGGVGNGGGTVLVPATPLSTKVPLLFRNRNTSGQQPAGMHIIGLGRAGSGNRGNRCRVEYTGTLSGVEMVVSSVTSATVENIAFADSTYKVKYGLTLCDYEGGGSFQGYWNHCSFDALAAGGIAQRVPMEGRSVSGHAASEMHFNACEFVGDAWCVWLSGQQTVTFFYRDSTHYVVMSVNTANSGDFWDGGTGFVAQDSNFSGGGWCNFYLTCEPFHGYHGGGAGPKALGIYSENTNAPFAFYVDGPQPQAQIVANDCRIGNQTGGTAYALFSSGRTRVIATNSPLPGDVFLHNTLDMTVVTWDSSITERGGRFGDGLFKATAPASGTLYSTAGQGQRLGRIELVNQSGQASTLATNAAGRIIVAQADAPILATGAGRAVDDVIAALQTAGWVRQS